MLRLGSPAERFALWFVNGKTECEYHTKQWARIFEDAKKFYEGIHKLREKIGLPPISKDAEYLALKALGLKENSCDMLSFIHEFEQIERDEDIKESVEDDHAEERIWIED